VINHPITTRLSHQVKAVDKTDLMVEVMYRELADFHKIKDEFVKEFSQEDFDWIVKVCFLIVSFNPFIYTTIPTKPLNVTRRVWGDLAYMQDLIFGGNTVNYDLVTSALLYFIRVLLDLEGDGRQKVLHDLMKVTSNVQG
jgi:hypothetical protein